MNLSKRLWGVFELAAIASFVYGFYAGDATLAIVGGSFLLLKDIGAVLIGVLSPTFPVLLAIALAIFIKPWYYGVFWASAAFAFLDIPTNLKRITQGR